MHNSASIFEPANAPSLSEVKEIEQAAVQPRIRVTQIGLGQPADIAPAFKRIAALGIKAYLTTRGPVMRAQTQSIAAYALQFKIPGMATSDFSVQAGELMSYGPSFDDNFRRAASYVDRIFKGATPGELPIEQPTRFELVVNMKTARAMGLTIPQSILLRAERVIE